MNLCDSFNVELQTLSSNNIKAVNYIWGNMNVQCVHV